MKTGSRPSVPRGLERYLDPRSLYLYERVWCGRVHFGLWLETDDTIASATARVPLAMADAIGLDEGDSVLEVGSGAAAGAIDVVQNHGCRIMATDVSPVHGAIGNAAIAAAGQQASITGLIADAEDLPFADGTHTAYWAQEVLVHVQRKNKALNEACRILATGGRIVFTEQTTNAAKMNDAERARFAERHGSNDLWNARHFVDAMEQAGFTDVAVIDWSDSIGQHLAALVERIDTLRPELDAACGAELIDWNRETWAFARDCAQDGKIGWHLFRGVKPA